MKSKAPFVIIFALMSVAAVYCLFGIILDSPALLTLDKFCPEKYYPVYETKRGSEAHRAYTGIQVIDQNLCLLTSFFMSTLHTNPSSYATTLAIVTAIPSIAIFPVIESVRRKSPNSILPSIGPLVLGIMYQRLGGGFILPLYCIYAILSGKLDENINKQIAPRQAFAVLIGLVDGYFIPSYLMLSTGYPTWIAFWQPFPILIWIFQFVGLLLIPNPPNFSGTRMIQFTYGLTFLSCAIFHLNILIKSGGSSSNLAEIFLPTLTPGNTLTLVSQNFLKWDYAFVFASAALFTLRMAKSSREAVMLLFTHLVVSPLLGAGSAFALIMIWRERRIEEAIRRNAKTD